MRSLAIFLIILLVIVGGVFAFLILTTPHQSADFHARLGTIADVPASAEWFAIIPSAAALDAKLEANPVTRAAIERWRANQPLPRPWMIGNADMIVWKSGDAIRYFIRVDPFRGIIVRTFLTTSGNVMINVEPEQKLDAATVAQVTQLASKLPAGDALVVQRENARGSYPPIARPSVTSVQLTPSEIRLTSMANGGSPSPSVPSVVNVPRRALLSFAFARPTRIIEDLNRLFGAKVSDLFSDGGMLCIYNVDARKFLPRPIGVIVLPDSPERRAAAGGLRGLANTATRGSTLLVSFDRGSIDQYQKDVFDPVATAGNQWTARIDPVRLVPILNDLRDNVGLRIVAPRLYRSARDLEGWISGLEQAKVIDATDSVDPSGETLQVRIASK